MTYNRFFAVTRNKKEEKKDLRYIIHVISLSISEKKKTSWRGGPSLSRRARDKNVANISLKSAFSGWFAHVHKT